MIEMLSPYVTKMYFISNSVRFKLLYLEMEGFSESSIVSF